MGNGPAIKVEGIGKRYRLGQTIDLTRTFRELVMDWPRTMARRVGLIRTPEVPSVATGAGPKAEIDEDPGHLWALRDVSFEVQPGEIVGLVGRNGAGKSTLLKILTRITPPSTGRIEINGRVGSLLEVGTGFHNELTGRENIYLNGAILGMRRQEISRKFDEIVAFAGTERFLDTPVKRYSSGMRVRLAFAVAAHLEPEILLIDEVLAVGDAEFQRRCLNKMDEIAEEGRTIIFVSHNLPALQRLCPRAILIEDGRVVDDNDSPSIIQRYLQTESEFGGERRFSYSESGEKYLKPLIPLAIRIMDDHGIISNRMISSQNFFIEFDYELPADVWEFYLTFTFCTQEGDFLVQATEPDIGNQRKAGRYRSRCLIPQSFFFKGGVMLGVIAGRPRSSERYSELNMMQLYIDDATSLSSAGSIYTRPKLNWETIQLPEESVEPLP